MSEEQTCLQTSVPAWVLPTAARRHSVWRRATGAQAAARSLYLVHPASCMILSILLSRPLIVTARAGTDEVTTGPYSPLG
jgi:hypothetical protein